MSIGDKISKDVNNSDDDVRKRAEEEEVRGATIANDGNEQDNKERKDYSLLIFIMVTIWLLSILSIFVLIGRRVLCYSDNVIIAFLTTTTINVTGLFLVVAKYLFPAK